MPAGPKISCCPLTFRVPHTYLWCGGTFCQSRIFFHILVGDVSGTFCCSGFYFHIHIGDTFGIPFVVQGSIFTYISEMWEVPLIFRVPFPHTYKFVRYIYNSGLHFHIHTSLWGILIIQDSIPTYIQICGGLFNYSGFHFHIHTSRNTKCVLCISDTSLWGYIWYRGFHSSLWGIFIIQGFTSTYGYVSDTLIYPEFHIHAHCVRGWCDSTLYYFTVYNQ